MSCPICNKASTEKFKPFCCKRCADIDLNRWFLGNYAIPTNITEDEDGELDDSDTYLPPE